MWPNGPAVKADCFGNPSFHLLAIRGRPEVIGHRPAMWTREITDGLRWVLVDPHLRTLACFGAVGNFALTGYRALHGVLRCAGFLVAAGPPRRDRDAPNIEALR